MTNQKVQYTTHCGDDDQLNYKKKYAILTQNPICCVVMEVNIN